MLARLLLLFIAVPLIELALLIRVGTLIGIWPTMAIVVATGVAGAALARAQGLRVWLGIRDDLRQGRMPVQGLVDGLLVLVGGVLLLTPGVLTDLLGIALLLPWTRAVARRYLRRRLERMRRTGQVHFTMLIR
ncbi:MAG: FxsA family protein [Gemmatimonadota bacterium]